MSVTLTVLNVADNSNLITLSHKLFKPLNIFLFVYKVGVIMVASWYYHNLLVLAAASFKQFLCHPGRHKCIHVS